LLGWRNVSTQKQLEEAYAELNQIFNSTADGMRVIDENFNIIRVNKKLLEMIDKTEEEVLGKKCYELFPEFNCKNSSCLLNLNKEGRDYVEFETKLFKEKGQNIPCNVVVTPFVNTEGNLVGVLESIRDITKRKEYEEKINILAYHDYLTGLPNRLCFIKFLEQEISKAMEAEGKFAVVFIDLDDFKSVNDSLGHSVGDKLLIEVAKRLSKVMRNIDRISRVGGDEFILYLADTENTDEIKKVAERILHAVEQPFLINGHEILVSASLGISIFSADGTDAETLIKRADISMYRAKEQGKNSYAFYTTELDKSLHNRLKSIKNLKNAIKEDEFILYYQPQYHARTRELVCLEALVRWRHPELGIIMPKDFIALAEETGLIVPLGKNILLAACRQLKEWQDKGIAPKRLAVNISPYQLKRHDFVEMLKDVFSETKISPEYLELEITESFAMEKSSYLNVLHELQALGVRIALDDFGTGYSSLSYLSSAPINIIKIDRSFVTQLANDNNKTIISAIIAMACTLGMDVVAEGVETDGQFAFLRRTNCRYLQGYLFSEPLPAHKIQNLLLAEKEIAKGYI
jgi:diguanylate cyclase (GGDEF)-like protein/PAS domain S-box-containing protein